jgi:predicted nucleic acid-binding protein
VLELLPVSQETLENAATVGARHRLKVVDAIHVATALAAGCDAFLTNDAGIRVSDGLRLVRLDAA